MSQKTLQASLTLRQEDIYIYFKETSDMSYII